MKRHKPGNDERPTQIEHVDRREVISLAREREDGVGARVDAPTDSAGEVHAQEREAGLGQRIDEVPNEVLPIWTKPVVLTPKRHDPTTGVTAGHRDDPV